MKGFSIVGPTLYSDAESRRTAFFASSGGCYDLVAKASFAASTSREFKMLPVANLPIPRDALSYLAV
jgi:hypothetical protein